MSLAIMIALAAGFILWILVRAFRSPAQYQQQQQVVEQTALMQLPASLPLKQHRIESGEEEEEGSEQMQVVFHTIHVLDIITMRLLWGLYRLCTKSPIKGLSLQGEIAHEDRLLGRPTHAYTSLHTLEEELGQEEEEQESVQEEKEEEDAPLGAPLLPTQQDRTLTSEQAQLARRKAVPLHVLASADMDGYLEEMEKVHTVVEKLLTHFQGQSITRTKFAPNVNDVHPDYQHRRLSRYEWDYLFRTVEPQGLYLVAGLCTYENGTYAMQEEYDWETFEAWLIEHQEECSLKREDKKNA